MVSFPCNGHRAPNYSQIDSDSARLRWPENLDEICLTFGQSEVLREGTDLTFVTYGYCCFVAEQAARVLSKVHGIEVEIVDLQTLNPVDLNGVAAALLL